MRMTRKDKYGNYYLDIDWPDLEYSLRNSDLRELEMAIERLGEYEDTGLEPEEVADRLEWINVKDRLPELGPDDVSDDVLIAVQYGYDPPDNRTVICVGYLLDENGDGNLSWWAMMPHNCASVGDPDQTLFKSKGRDRVTHWMPLPKPPEEEENDEN